LPLEGVHDSKTGVSDSAYTNVQSKPVVHGTATPDASRSSKGCAADSGRAGDRGSRIGGAAGGSEGGDSGGNGGAGGGMGATRRKPQSAQSVPHAQMAYSESGPPSSQTPSPATWYCASLHSYTQTSGGAGLGGGMGGGGGSGFGGDGGLGGDGGGGGEGGGLNGAATSFTQS